MKTVCLVMIVRDEAETIKRCLASVKPWIDHWAITDTGSLDQTPQIIAQELSGIPGMLYRIPWTNFESARTTAMVLAKAKADYHLLLDADMTLAVDSEFRNRIEADAYYIAFTGSTDYSVIRLVSDEHDWSYHGVTHEYIDSPTAERKEKLDGISVVHHCDGGTRHEKYQRDLNLLLKAVETEPENARYAFYLAQTYRDIGLGYQAYEWYRKRTVMAGWPEETWYAMYQSACLQHSSAMDWPQVLNSYLTAYEFRPSRAEPLFQIAKHYRQTKQFALGYVYASATMEIPYPQDILYVQRNVYEYELPLEYAICCYWLGKHEEAIRVNDQIIGCPNTPPNFLEAAKRNRQFSIDTPAARHVAASPYLPRSEG